MDARAGGSGYTALARMQALHARINARSRTVFYPCYIFPLVVADDLEPCPLNFLNGLLHTCMARKWDALQWVRQVE
jgi:hypothetical protein